MKKRYSIQAYNFNDNVRTAKVKFKTQLDSTVNAMVWVTDQDLLLIVGLF